MTLTCEDGEKKDIPIERIYDLYCFGEYQYNSALFSFLGSKGISVHLFNYYDFYVGSFIPRETMVSGSLLVKQVEYFSDYEKRMVLAKEFIAAGSDNIVRNLRYYQNRGRELNDQIGKIENLQTSIMKTMTIEELMGIEGNIRQIYYETFNSIIQQEINFTKRVKRPPDNMINTLISYLNTLLYTKILSEIYCTQLNPTISYLHVPGSKRFSLPLDVSEVFKPLIVDRLIFSLLNKNQISDDDFEKDLGYLKIKEKSIRTIVNEFDKRLQTTIHHRTLDRDVSYKHLIRLELYKLIKHLLGEEVYKGFRIWW